MLVMLSMSPCTTHMIPFFITSTSHQEDVFDHMNIVVIHGIINISGFSIVNLIQIAVSCFKSVIASYVRMYAYTILHKYIRMYIRSCINSYEHRNEYCINTSS